MPREGDEQTWDEWYRKLSNDDRQKLKKLADVAPKVGPQPGPQTMAFNSKAEVLGYGGAAGGGKGLLSACNHWIFSPQGRIRGDSIKVGTKICDAYGGVQKVLAIKDWENWKVWRVHFSDGTHVDTSPEHIWLAWRAHVGATKRTHPDADNSGRVHGPKAARLFETQGILREMERGRRYRIPLCEPARGNFNRYNIDPYLLGALLGDGYMPRKQGCTISVHEDDVQILKECEAASDGYFNIRNRYDKINMVAGYLSTKSPDHARLRDMGMIGKRAWEKELPKSACFAPIEWRWSLLQGLMDTDGWVEEKRCAYYTTTSPKLRDGVTDLARSLGCFVTICDKKPTYTYREEKWEGRDAYTIRIKSATPEKLFRLRRKKYIAARLEHQSLAKEITDIETDIGRDTIRCIQVDHPSGLYLTNDYTVTHNSALIAILALLRHQRTVVYRWDKVQLNAFIDDLIRFFGTQLGLNRQSGYFYFGDYPGHMLEWVGIGKPGAEQKMQGRPHDLLAVDEATQLPLDKLLYLNTWLRTTKPKQRCRIVYTFNPPGAENEDGEMDDGKWVIDFFAPWLDERHVNPAEPGEIRYFLTDAGGEVEEVASPDPVEMTISGKTFVNTPQARTFIPASVQDNQYLRGTGYEQSLLNLPDEMRARMLLGDFRSGIVDNPNQILPTAWVDAAMDRWSPDGRRGEMSALGVDVARGGRNFTVLSPRYGFWWDKITRRPGTDTPDGPAVASMCMQAVRDAAWINIDANGVGSSPYDQLKRANMRVKGLIMQQRKNLRRLPDGAKAYNLRSWLFWLLRCILDPKWDLHCALPKDKRLRSDLVAIKFSITNNGEILAESKDEIKDRLRRSTDDGDAVAYSIHNVYTEPEMDRLQYRSAPSVYVNDQVELDGAIGYPTKLPSRNDWMGL